MFAHTVITGMGLTVRSSVLGTEIQAGSTPVSQNVFQLIEGDKIMSEKEMGFTELAKAANNFITIINENTSARNQLWQMISGQDQLGILRMTDPLGEVMPVELDMSKLSTDVAEMILTVMLDSAEKEVIHAWGNLLKISQQADKLIKIRQQSQNNEQEFPPIIPLGQVNLIDNDDYPVS